PRHLSRVRAGRQHAHVCVSSSVTSKYRVLHFLSQLPVADYFVELSRHMDRERFDVLACTLERTGRVQELFADAGMPALSLGCRGRWGYPLAVAKLASFLRRERIDILHTHIFDPTI